MQFASQYFQDPSYSGQVVDPEEGQMARNIRLELVPLLHAGVTSNGADVDHSVTELHKGTTLLGQLQLGNVAEAEVRQFLVFLFTEPLDEAVARERLAQAVGNQAVLGEAEVEESGDIRGSRSQLLLLFHKVRAADLLCVREGERNADGRSRTYPMAHLWRKRESSSSISGLTVCR